MSPGAHSTAHASTVPGHVAPCAPLPAAVPAGTSCPAFVVDLQTPLTPGQSVVVEMSYSAVLYTPARQRGLWRSHPFPATNTSATPINPHVLITSQLERDNARAVFPCIDQPDQKATFALTLQAPSRFAALSNTPVASRAGSTVTFRRTPVMSTYLLSLAVGDLITLRATSKADPGALCVHACVRVHECVRACVPYA